MRARVNVIYASPSGPDFTFGDLDVGDYFQFLDVNPGNYIPNILRQKVEGGGAVIIHQPSSGYPGLTPGSFTDPRPGNERPVTPIDVTITVHGARSAIS